ncbi:hypothetical protein SEA_LUCKYBARNES_48 [Brevibacterium phage LuckyBarnes]|uniref:Uncharacterized protein n=1 Tax=Brevibacterium phage LuckyBarnes TaxID=2027888 RepID=A0A249XNR1_9CAUD|nr:hypothetical protein HOS02_gp48 [Brevibacterium phage LuckyBarnes]ASZ73365.1 hypothetical protein SEA_LUCKYBARNES_48 [Brevibacterium phage LuckyBarnes]
MSSLAPEYPQFNLSLTTARVDVPLVGEREVPVVLMTSDLDGHGVMTFTSLGGFDDVTMEDFVDVIVVPMAQRMDRAMGKKREG